MLKLERQKTSAVDVAIILKELKLNLHEKRVNSFVPHQAKCILEKLEKDGEVNAKFFLNQTTSFYEKCESNVHAFTRNVNHTWMFIDMPTKV